MHIAGKDDAGVNVWVCCGAGVWWHIYTKYEKEIGVWCGSFGENIAIALFFNGNEDVEQCLSWDWWGSTSLSSIFVYHSNDFERKEPLLFIKLSKIDL